MKKYISLAVALLCLGLFFACGRGYVPMPPADETPSMTTAEIWTEPESETTEEVFDGTEATTESTTMRTSATTITASAAKASAAAVMQYTAATPASKLSSATAYTTTTRVTTTTTAPPALTAAPATTTAAQGNPPAPVYTQTDYEAIIAEVRRYAESRTNARFVWNPKLTREMANQGLAGYHGMPNLTRHGKDSVITSLKYHVDLTEEHVARNAHGMEPIVNYHVYWYVDTQGTWGFGPNDVCFILIYG